MVGLAKIIAFGSQKRVGKNTAAIYATRWCHKQGKRAALLSFAAPMKKVCSDLFNDIKAGEFYEMEEYQYMKEELIPSLNESPRSIYQKVATFFRGIDPDIWVKNTLTKTHLYTNDVILISDLRFKNEYDNILHNGGYCVKITRPNLPPNLDPLDQGLNDVRWDAVIDNNSDLIHLQKEVETLCSKWLL